MRAHDTWQSRLGAKTPDEVFKFLMGNLTRSITTYAYFIDWKKVDTCWESVKHEVHLLDSLVHAKDAEKELDALLQKYPEVAKAFPALIAVRMDDGPEMHILKDYKGGILTHETFVFDGKPLDAPGRAKLVRFARETGILDLLTRRVTKSIPDYARGVEAGLDSNGRKNRGGQLMENVVAEVLDKLCRQHGWKWISQPTSKKVKAKWGLIVKDKQTKVRPDFGVLTPKGLWLIETNFYNRQGSKLKATAGEYKGKFDDCIAQGHRYLWITDGTGWEKSEAALRECFDILDFTLTLEMCARGCLEDILSS